MKIEVGKLYRTRSGRKVRIYALDGTNNDIFWPIHGAYEGPEGQWSPSGWYPDGKRMPSRRDDHDIVSEWKEPLSVTVRVRWEYTDEGVIPRSQAAGVNWQDLVDKTGTLTFVEDGE